MMVNNSRQAMHWTVGYAEVSVTPVIHEGQPVWDWLVERPNRSAGSTCRELSDALIGVLTELEKPSFDDDPGDDFDGRHYSSVEYEDEGDIQF